MDFKSIIRDSVRETLKKSGKLPESAKANNKGQSAPQLSENKISTVNSLIVKEALVATPQTFHLNTERLSEETKRSHEQLYNGYVEKFNRASSGLDSANVNEANSNRSDYRSLKIDETFNLNAMKFHELYFNNISDLVSEISVDSLPYMRLARDFGSFERWQFDFMASCRSARNGWGVVVYEPYKNVYMNIVVDLHTSNVPLGAIPVLVIDMWEHAYFNDYQTNKDDYIVAMMREINWNVVEARMALSEKTELGALYMIKPSYNIEPKKMLDAATSPPINKVSSPGQIDVPPTTPPAPETIAPNMRRSPQ